MRRTTWIATLALLTPFVTSCAPTYGQTRVETYRGPSGAMSVSLFYDNLDPYGEWIDYGPYGWCWTPYDISPTWRPYTDGYWVYSDFGWSWVSHEPFGWATYHYGRWIFDPAWGWIWIPGTDWAPAWVAWRYTDDWIGWAPLPPDAVWQVSAGLRYTGGRGIPDPGWCFVHSREFLDTNLRTQVVSVARNGPILSHSRDATRFEARHGRPVNHGIDVARVERWTGKPVHEVQVADAPSPPQGGRKVRGDRVEYFRPHVQESSPGRGSRPRPRRAGLPGSGSASNADWQTRKRHLEDALQQERAGLERSQEAETRSRPQGISRKELEQRHAAERAAFRKHEERQRQILEERRRKGIRPDPGRGPGSSADRDRTPKKKGSGNRSGKGG